MTLLNYEAPAPFNCEIQLEALPNQCLARSLTKRAAQPVASNLHKCKAQPVALTNFGTQPMVPARSQSTDWALSNQEGLLTSHLNVKSSKQHHPVGEYSLRPRQT